MIGFIIYRNGSNAANQHLCDKMPVAIDWDSETGAEAIRKIEESELFTLYANQWFTAERVEDFDGTDDDFIALQEEIEERQRFAQPFRNEEIQQ